MLTLATARFSTAQGVPDPVPVKTDVRVGTYIFPMWLRPGTDGHGNENWNEWATLRKVDAASSPQCWRF